MRRSPTSRRGGAAFVREESYGDQLGHVVLIDPAGNEFCVA